MPETKTDIVRPAITLKTESLSTDTDWSALVFGGAPNLSPEVNWPRGDDRVPLHFFAQFDLSDLPTTFRQKEHLFEMPTRPNGGTVFVFLPLTEDGLIAGKPPVFLFHAGDTRELPLRQPPADTPELNEFAQIVDLASISPCKKMLKRRKMIAETCLTHFDVNPLLLNMRRVLSPDEMYEHERAYADELAAYGIKIDVPLPRPDAAREALFDKMPRLMAKHVEKGHFQWSWEYIFEVSRRIVLNLYDMPIREIERQVERGNDSPRYFRFIERKIGKRRQQADVMFNTRSSLWHWLFFRDFYTPPFNLGIDHAALRWMRYAKMQRDRPLTEEVKEAFVSFISSIDREEAFDEIADLSAFFIVSNNRFTGWDVRMKVQDVFYELAEDRKDMHPDRPIAYGVNFGRDEALPPQLFGFGHLMQHAAEKHLDKVLLLQCEADCGLDFRQVSGILQFWIDADDLANARFDNIITTLECT
ncbi:DUF1963 domain-containing protein [Yoonia sp. 2307UL14-13]|uniref:DUF1963 domain-containing protein n=1 Tax=Yoonia sp. 2307UL14-13 TaxID=3126506 RepID=UPI00309C3CC9